MAAEIDGLEIKCTSFDGEGRTMLAARCLERILSMREKLGVDTREGSLSKIADTAERLIVHQNVVAVDAFTNGDFAVAAEQLNQALALTAPLKVDGDDYPQDQLGDLETTSDNEGDPSLRPMWSGKYFPRREDSETLRRLRATTYNNLGCLERRRGKLNAALSYLRRARRIAPAPSSSTLLNLSSVCSQMGRAGDAILHARTAVAIIEAEFATARAKGNDVLASLSVKSTEPKSEANTTTSTIQPVSVNASTKSLTRKESKSGLSSTTGSSNTTQRSTGSINPLSLSAKRPEVTPPAVLAVAYHNLALALEGMHDSEECIHTYRKAYEIAMKLYSIDDELPKLIDRNLSKFHALLKERKKTRADQHLASTPHTAGFLQSGDMSRGGSASRRSSLASSRRGSMSSLGKAPSDQGIAPHPPGLGSLQMSSSINTSGASQGRIGFQYGRKTSVGRNPLQQRKDGERDPDKLTKEEEALLAQPVDLLLTDDEARGVVPADSVISGAAIVTDTNSIAHRTLKAKVEEKEAKRQAQLNPHQGDAAVAIPLKPQPPSGRGYRSGRGGRGAGSSTIATRRKTERVDRDGSTNPLYVAPPKQPPVVDIDEEDRKRDDLVGFLASRLTQLVRAEEAYELRYQAAKTIQCAIRKGLALRAARERRFAREQKDQLQRVVEISSARRVIRFFAGLVKKRKEREVLQKLQLSLSKRKTSAAIKIQSISRMWLAKQQVIRLRKFYKRFFIAVGKVQCWLRQMRAKLMAQRMRKSLAESTAEKAEVERRSLAASKIQATYKRHRAKIATLLLRGDAKAALQRDWQRNRTTALVRIQSWWRGILVRRVTNKTLKTQRKIRQQTERTQRRRRASVEIQRVYRGYRTRKHNPQVRKALEAHRKRVEERRRFQAARRIQCAQRCRRAREERNRRRAAKKGGDVPAQEQHPVIDLTAWVNGEVLGLKAV